LSFAVRLTREAEEDLLRLFEFVLERELERGGDLELAQRAQDAIEEGLATLARSPFTCRKAADSSFLRELVIPCGHTGYVALFEIADSENVVVGALRHQREDDFH